MILKIKPLVRLLLSHICYAYRTRVRGIKESYPYFCWKTEERKRMMRSKQSINFDYPLGSDSIVFDVGGYKGDFAAGIYYRYSSKIYLFEPVKTFLEVCKKRFEGNSKIQCLPFGLADRAGEFSISLANEASSVNRKDQTGLTEIINIKDFKSVFEDLKLKEIDLISINIEGGEYDLLTHIIEVGLIQKIKYIQIQFHDFIPGAEVLRDKIQKSLLLTHKPMWCYSFVWESWERL